jgi:hypothetical protein
MLTECSPDLFGFTAVGGREVVAGFDGGCISWELGGFCLARPMVRLSWLIGLLRALETPDATVLLAML